MKSLHIYIQIYAIRFSHIVKDMHIYFSRTLADTYRNARTVALLYEPIIKRFNFRQIVQVADEELAVVAA